MRLKKLKQLSMPMNRQPMPQEANTQPPRSLSGFSEHAAMQATSVAPVPGKSASSRPRSSETLCLAEKHSSQLAEAIEPNAANATTVKTRRKDDLNTAQPHVMDDYI
ncbi:MAG: hypothetical protein KJ622_02400 [Alphaproteobacteria bacterium]|nr:hypothetical protein [Alphaproteobacteria bacterium]